MWISQSPRGEVGRERGKEQEGFSRQGKAEQSAPSMNNKKFFFSSFLSCTKRGPAQEAAFNLPLFNVSPTHRSLSPREKPQPLTSFLLAFAGKSEAPAMPERKGHFAEKWLHLLLLLRS